MPVDQLHALYSRYQHAVTTDPNHHAEQFAGSFAQDLYQLLARYADAASCQATPAGTIITKGEWSLPPAILSAEIDHTGANTERYASLLNAHPSVQTYYTPLKADALFGSQGNTHKYRWSGASTAVPPSDAAAVTKAVKHAIESAKADGNGPVLAFLAIPAMAETQHPVHLKLLTNSPGWCRPVLKLPAQQLKYTAQAPFMQDTMSQQRAPWDTLLVEIDNKQGMQLHSTARNPATHSAFLRAVMEAINAARPAEQHVKLAQMKAYNTRAKHYVLPQQTASPETHRATAKMRKKPVDTQLPRPGSTVQSAPLPAEMHTPPPLRDDWRAMA